MQWYRLYAEFATDPKIQALAFEDQRHFVVLLCLKAGGTLDTFTGTDAFRERMIAVGLGLSDDKSAEAKKRLLEAGLISADWQPLAWNRRQFKSDHDTTAAERQQRWRERHALRNGDVTRRDTDTDTDTDTEAEKSQKRTRASARAATRIPTDFQLTPERRLVAEAETLHAERTFAKFVDYWRAASGAKARKHDWDATWRNWCRSEADRSRGSAPIPKRSTFVAPLDEPEVTRATGPG